MPRSNPKSQAPTSTHSKLIERSEIQSMEELRTTLETHRIDEQGEEDRLDARIDRDTKLANDNADQQSTGDSTKNKAANLDLSDKITNGDRGKERDQRLIGEEVPQKFHSLVLDARRQSLSDALF
jgi:hypothetical protein